MKSYGMDMGNLFIMMKSMIAFLLFLVVLETKAIYLSKKQFNVNKNRVYSCGFSYLETRMRYNISVFPQVYSHGYFGVNFVLDYIVRNGRKVKES